MTKFDYVNIYPFVLYVLFFILFHMCCFYYNFLFHIHTSVQMRANTKTLFYLHFYLTVFNSTSKSLCCALNGLLILGCSGLSIIYTDKFLPSIHSSVEVILVAVFSACPIFGLERPHIVPLIYSITLAPL